VDVAHIERRLNQRTGYVATVRTFGATPCLARTPALARARGFDVWAVTWICRNRAANEERAAALVAGALVLRRGSATCTTRICSP
jgi:hypothetical protein